jgi:glycosyltransferase involved in cell wall biosynthesis
MILARSGTGNVSVMRATGPVRVLHVVKGLGPGGAERLLVSMASVADTTLVHYEVGYLLPWKGHLVPELEALAVPVHRLAGRGGMKDPAWVVRLRRMARDFDVVHFHSPAVAAIGRPVLRSVRGRPSLASTEHNVWGSHAGPTRVLNALTLPLDDVRWAVSDEVVSSSWAPWRRKTEVLIHGIPRGRLHQRREERAQVRAEQGWSEQDVVVTVVANMRAHKDYPTLFKAAASALAEEPRLRFVSIGQGPLEAQLRARLRTWDLGDRFVMLGYHADPAAVLAGSDVFTLSSRHEGLPISLLEAMALGLPPVITAVGANAAGVEDKVVSDGAEGVVVDPGRPDLLAAAYVRLARDVDLRKRLGDAAAARAVDFDISKTARVVEARYVALAAPRNGRAVPAP